MQPKNRKNFISQVFYSYWTCLSGLLAVGQCATLIVEGPNLPDLYYGDELIVTCTVDDRYISLLQLRAGSNLETAVYYECLTYGGMSESITPNIFRPGVRTSCTQWRHAPGGNYTFIGVYRDTYLATLTRLHLSCKYSGRYPGGGAGGGSTLGISQFQRVALRPPEGNVTMRVKIERSQISNSSPITNVIVSCNHTGAEGSPATTSYVYGVRVQEPESTTQGVIPRHETLPSGEEARDVPYTIKQQVLRYGRGVYCTDKQHINYRTLYTRVFMEVRFDGPNTYNGRYNEFACTYSSDSGDPICHPFGIGEPTTGTVPTSTAPPPADPTTTGLATTAPMTKVPTTASVLGSSIPTTIGTVDITTKSLILDNGLLWVILILVGLVLLLGCCLYAWYRRRRRRKWPEPVTSRQDTSKRALPSTKVSQRSRKSQRSSGRTDNVPTSLQSRHRQTAPELPTEFKPQNISPVFYPSETSSTYHQPMVHSKQSLPASHRRHKSSTKVRTTHQVTSDPQVHEQSALSQALQSTTGRTRVKVKRSKILN